MNECHDSSSHSFSFVIVEFSLYLSLDMASVCMSLLPANLSSWAGALWTFVSAPPLGGTEARTRGRQLELAASRLLAVEYFGVAGNEMRDVLHTCMKELILRNVVVAIAVNG